MRKIRSPCRLATDRNKIRSNTHHQMSPRAFQTIIVASMGSKDRLELESKVLAAALKQSHARGDSSGVSLAHKQIFLLLRQQQSAEKAEKAAEEAVAAEPAKDPETHVEVTSKSDETGKKRRRVMPDIVWTSDDDSDSDAANQSDAETRDPAASAADEAHDQSKDDNGDRAKPQDEGLIDFSSSQETEAHGQEETVSAEASDVDGEKANFNAYGILAVEQIASFEEIHRSFLFLVRRILLALKKAKRKQRKPLLDELQNLWIAHDILSDPVTRTDFDFRVLGLRGAPDVLIHSAPEDKSDSISSRTPLRIGELMQCAGLLEPTELEIAADMHKAMPEMLFGAFLVKQGFISEEDLGQVLTGQRLLKNGNMTVGHYQMCMKSWREDRVPIEETAVAEGFVTQQEMERVIASGQRETVTGVTGYTGGNVSLRATAPHINQEEAAKRKFSAGHAVPLWKDQLDWSEPEAIQAYVDEEPDFEHRKPVESSLDIEGITDAVTSKDGKKSLRRLMEGIHSSPESASGEEGGVSKSLKNIFGQPTDSGPQALLAGSEPPEESVAADARAAEQVLKDAQATAASSDRDAYAEDVEPAATSSTAAPQFDSSAGKPEGESLSEQLALAPAPEHRPTAEVPKPKIMMAGGNRNATVSVDEDNVFGEINYDDEDDAEKDADLAFVGDDDYSDSLIEPYGAAPSSVTETASIEAQSVDTNSDDLLDFSTSSDSESSSEIRKVLDEAFHGVRTAETEVITVNQDQPAAPAQPVETTFDALSDEEAEMESGVFEAVVDQASQDNEVSKTDGNHQDLSAAIQAAKSTYDSERNAGEFRLSSIIIESIEKESADESTGETVAVSVSDSEKSGEHQAPEWAPEPVQGESGDDDSQSDADRHSSADTARDGGSRETVSMEMPPVVQNLPESDEQIDQSITRGMEGVGGELEIKLSAVSADDETRGSALEAEPADEVANEASAGKEDDEDTGETRGAEAVSTEEENAAIQNQSGDSETVAPDAASPGNEQDEEDSNRKEEQSPSSSEDTQNPPVQVAEEKAPESKAGALVPTQVSSADSDTVKLTDVSGSIPDIAPLEETPSTRLKSGEWQIVYKLEGSIADAFLSEEEEKEMPRLRPRLTEIDSIIPSSIAKLAKGDTTGSGSADGSTDQDTAKGESTTSDKPVIKPVSNNYYRNDKSKSNEKGGKPDKGDKGDKGKGKKD